MRITVSQLRRIIKEEVSKAVGGAPPPPAKMTLKGRTDSQTLAELLNLDYDAIRYSDNPGPEEKMALKTLQSAVTAINSGKSTASQVSAILMVLPERFVFGGLPGGYETILQDYFS